MDEFAIYARLLAEDLGVTVQFTAGAQPATNGRAIVIDGPPNSPAGRQLAYGKLLHEAGHITETSFAALSGLTGNRLHIVYILEDVRMEMRQVRKFQGAKAKLKEMVRALVVNGYFSPPTSQASPAERLGATLLYGLRAQCLGQDAVAQYAREAFDLAAESLSVGTMTRVFNTAAKVQSCKSTQDVVALAHEIVKVLEDEQKQEPDAQDQQQDQAQGQNQPDAQDQQQDQAQGQGQPDPQDQQQDQAQGQGQDGVGDKAEAIRRILSDEDDLKHSDLGEDVDRAISAEVESHGADSSAAVDDPVVMQSPTGDAASLLSRIRNESMGLRKRVENLFVAEAEWTKQVGRRGKKFAKGKAIRVCTGDTRVWERRAKSEDIDTAIQILVDTSVSMGRDAALARDAAMAAWDAFSKIDGVSVAVASFRSRHSPLVAEMALFDESPRKACGRFIHASADGGTPTTQALMYAGKKLVLRPEQRKLVMVVTDGEPNCMTSARAWIDLLERQGIEVMGIGIGCEIDALIAHSCSIHDVASLKEKLTEVLKKKLMSH